MKNRGALSLLVVFLGSAVVTGCAPRVMAPRIPALKARREAVMVEQAEILTLREPPEGPKGFGPVK